MAFIQLGAMTINPMSSPIGFFCSSKAGLVVVVVELLGDEQALRDRTGLAVVVVRRPGEAASPVEPI